MTRPSWHSLGLAGLLLAGILLPACGGAGGKKVRIVVITIDTLRQECLNGDEQGNCAMPLTRAYADRGHRFAWGYSSTSTTQPSHATLFTGLHPWQHGVVRNGTVLVDSHRTLAEYLADAGFENHAVVSSFPVDSQFGFDQGFDTFDDDFDLDFGRQEWSGKEVDDHGFYSLAATINEKAFAALDAAEGRKQFFWFHYFDAHDPYGDTTFDQANPHAEAVDKGMTTKALRGLAQARDERLQKAIAEAWRQYDVDVADMDVKLGELFERLDRDAEEYETHVLFTADHGESFGDDLSLGHGSRLTPQQVHVPLFIVSPLLEPKVRQDAAGAVDVFETVLALAGVESEQGTFGRDLVSTDAGSVFGMRRKHQGTKQDPRIDGTFERLATPRFYAVKDGVLYAGNSERVVRNTVPEAPVADEELATKLKALFKTFETQLSSSATVEMLDAETQDALRSLGYTY